MAYKDLSDSNLQLSILAKKKQDMENAKKDSLTNVSKITSNLWKMYSSGAAAQAGRMLSKEIAGENIFEIDPNFEKKDFLSKTFVPAGGRVRLTDEGESYKKAASIYEQGLKDNPDLTQGDDFFANTYDEIGNITGKFTDYNVAGAGTEVGIKDINDATDFSKTATEATSEGSQTLGESGKEFTKDGLGKTIGYLGAGYSAYDMLSNWDERNAREKQESVLDTTLSIASLFNPYVAAGNLIYKGAKIFT